MAFLVGDLAMRVLRYGWTTLKGYGEVSLLYYTVLHCIFPNSVIPNLIIPNLGAAPPAWAGSFDLG